MKEYIKPSVIKIRDENGTFVPMEGLRGPKGEPGGPLWIRYSAHPDGTDLSVNWSKGMTYIGLSIDPNGPFEDKTKYNWIELPKGDVGPVGPKGDKGDNVRFAYASQPYERKIYNGKGTIEIVYDNECSPIWTDDMTWLGVYSGSKTEVVKSDYTWIKLPQGEPGASAVKVKYGKKDVNVVESVTTLQELYCFNPFEGYYYETDTVLSIADNVGENNRILNLSRLFVDQKLKPSMHYSAYTSVTNKRVYEGYDEVANTNRYFVYEDESHIREVQYVRPDEGYYVDTDTLVEHTSNLILDQIKGKIVLTKNGIYDGIVYCTRPSIGNTIIKLYRVDKYKNDGSPVYRQLEFRVGISDFTKTDNKLTFNYNGWDRTWDTEFTHQLVLNAKIKDIPDEYVYRIWFTDSTGMFYSYWGTMVWGAPDDWNNQTVTFTILEGVDWRPEYYIPTNSYIKNPDITNLTEISAKTTNGDKPVYMYKYHEPDTVSTDYKYVLVNTSIDSYANIEYLDTYNEEADLIGFYFGNKTSPDVTDYQWLRLRGETGRTGGPVFIRYAKQHSDGVLGHVDVESILTTWDDGYDYIGIGVGEDKQGVSDYYGEGTNSDDSIYNWIPLPKGLQGPKGDKGDDGKPSAFAYRYSPFPDGKSPDTGKPVMYEDRSSNSGNIYIGISKTAYYDPVSNTVITDEENPDNYLWLEMPDKASIDAYGGRIAELQTEVNEISTKVDIGESIQRNIEAYRVATQKADNANVDKLNVTINYMREMLNRIRILEGKHNVSGDNIELPYFAYTTAESANTPTNISFGAHVQTNANNRYDVYYLSSLCTNDSTVWIKLKSGYNSVVSSTDVYMYRVPLDPAKDIEKVSLSDKTYAYSDGYYWYLLLKSNITDQLIKPMLPAVPESLYDYLIIERDEPSDT